jgi:Antibiotic biosynthesis monooxygenase
MAIEHLPVRRIRLPEFHEIVRGTIKPGVEEKMIQRRPELEAEVKEALPGLIEITLIKLDDGTYIDYLRWESREAADAAAKRFDEVPAAVEIHGYGEEDFEHHRGEEAVAAAAETA